MSATLRLQHLEDLRRGLAGPACAVWSRASGDEAYLEVVASCGRHAVVTCEQRADYGGAWVYVVAEQDREPMPVTTVDEVARAVLTIQGFLGTPPVPTREPLIAEQRRRETVGLIRLH